MRIEPKSSCVILAFTMITSLVMAQHNDRKVKGISHAYRKYFPIGVAVNVPALQKADEVELIVREFRSVTPENAMKMDAIHPRPNVYFWKDADAIVEFAQKHKMKVRGHALLWHQQVPDWIFKDLDGKQIGRDTLLKRLKDHIFNLVGRYKGKVYAWDVANEVIDDDPKNYLRKSKWLEIIGEDFVAKAFEYAHQADPDALLFYNDYNSERPSKRDKIYRLVKELKDAGVRIDGIGLQSHWSIFEPSETELRQAIEKFVSLDVKLHFTEVDMSIYPWEKENRKKSLGEVDSLTPELEEKQIEQYTMVFRIFREYKEHITNVTFWNISDRYSWLDYYPVDGRKNYPLLFDQQLKRKKAYDAVVNFK